MEGGQSVTAACREARGAEPIPGAVTIRNGRLLVRTRPVKEKGEVTYFTIGEQICPKYQEKFFSYFFYLKKNFPLFS